MIEKELEEYYNKIEEIYFTYQGNGFFEEDMREQKVKEIINNIYYQGCEDGR